MVVSVPCVLVAKYLFYSVRISFQWQAGQTVMYFARFAASGYHRHMEESRRVIGGLIL